MAQIGLTGFFVGEYVGDEKEKSILFTNGKKIAKAIDLNLSWGKSTAELYADNGLDDSITAVTGGDIKFTPNDISEEEFYPLLGIGKKKVKINGKEVDIYATGADAEGKEVGFGYVMALRKTGEQRYKAVIIPRTKFSIPDSEDSKTKGNSIELTTSQVQGKILMDAAGNYKYEEVFDTEEDAIALIEEILEVA